MSVFFLFSFFLRAICVVVIYLFNKWISFCGWSRLCMQNERINEGFLCSFGSEIFLSFSLYIYVLTGWVGICDYRTHKEKQKKTKTKTNKNHDTIVPAPLGRLLEADMT